MNVNILYCERSNHSCGGGEQCSQPPNPGINYTGPQEVLLEFVILVF